MKKIFVVAAIASLAISVAACGNANRTIASYKGYTNVCVNGVNYLQFPSGATVQLDQNNNVVHC